MGNKKIKIQPTCMNKFLDFCNLVNKLLIKYKDGKLLVEKFSKFF